jgi:4-oxalocrotonate tautomerase
MPYLNVKICAPQSQETTQQVVAFLTEHTAAILGKRNEVISVGIEYISNELWTIGGKTLKDQGLATFYLDIKITDGTNTKNEKANYIQKVFAEFEAVLGRLNPASYIVVQDVRADAWGYAGETQEYRYIKGKVL